MGRRKKKNHNGLRNLGLVSLAVVVGVYAKLNIFNEDFQMPQVKMPTIQMPAFFNRANNNSRINESILPDEIPITDIKSINKEQNMVKIFYISQKNGKEVYRIIRRENTTDKTNVEYAVENLFEGPTKYEKNKGVYSEIPASTRLLSVVESPTKVTINVSQAFGNMGGADSLYKRMYQLIKTVNTNTTKPVYLEINGQMVETLGGEGLMIKQPLDGSSLDG